MMGRRRRPGLVGLVGLVAGVFCLGLPLSVESATPPVIPEAENRYNTSSIAARTDMRTQQFTYVHEYPDDTHDTRFSDVVIGTNLVHVIGFAEPKNGSVGSFLSAATASRKPNVLMVLSMSLTATTPTIVRQTSIPMNDTLLLNRVAEDHNTGNTGGRAVYVDSMIYIVVTTGSGSRRPGIVCVSESDHGVVWTFREAWSLRDGLVGADKGTPSGDGSALAVDKAADGTLHWYLVENIIGGSASGFPEGSVVKLALQGQLQDGPSPLWRRAVVGTVVPDTRINAIVLASGRIYVCGQTKGDMDGDGPGYHRLSFDAFFMEMTTDSAILSVQHSASPLVNMCVDIAVDDSGHVITLSHGIVKAVSSSLDDNRAAPRPSSFTITEVWKAAPGVAFGSAAAQYSSETTFGFSVHSSIRASKKAQPAAMAINSYYLYMALSTTNVIDVTQSVTWPGDHTMQSSIGASPLITNPTYLRDADRALDLQTDLGLHGATNYFLADAVPAGSNELPVTRRALGIACGGGACFSAGVEFKNYTKGIVTRIGLCQAGTIAGVLRLTSEPHWCYTCPTGSIQTQESGFYCAKCSPGSYAPPGHTGDCLPCPAGQYQSSYGQSSCLPCGVGTFANTTGQVTCHACPSGTYQTSTGQGQCLGCPAGTSSAAVGASAASVCTQCAPGSYSQSTAAGACDACEAGYYQDGSGQTACKPCPLLTQLPATGGTALSQCVPCPAGSHSKATPGAATCPLCRPGQYQNATGQVQCIDCPVHYYANTPGTTACKECPSGTWSRLPGAAECPKCEPGQYQDKAMQSNCKLCSPNHYADVPGSSNCTRCPDDSSAPGGSVHVMACQCDAGTFGSPSEGRPCVACPPGGKCDQGQVWPKVPRGRWIDTARPYVMQSCVPRDSCAGGEPEGLPDLDAGALWLRRSGKNVTALSTDRSAMVVMSVASYYSPCSAGYVGTACRSCADGYYRSKGKCLACLGATMPESVSYVLMTFGALGLVVVFVIIVCARSLVQMVTRRSLAECQQTAGGDDGFVDEDRSLAGRLLDTASRLVKFLQVLVLLLNIKTSWPSTLRSLGSAIAVSTLDINDLFALECQSGKSAAELYKDRYHTRLFIPVFFFVSVVLLYALSYCIKVALAATIHCRGRGRVYRERNPFHETRPRRGRLTGGDEGEELMSVEAAEMKTHRAWEACQNVSETVVRFSMRVRNNSVMLGAWLLVLLYLVVHSAVVELWSCAPTGDDGGTHLLSAEASIECFKSDSVWMDLLPLSILGFFVLSLGMPLAVIVVVCMNHSKSLHNPEINDRFGVLWRSYRRKQYHWEIVTMAFKFVVTLGSSLAVLAPSDQLYFMLAVILVFTTLQTWFKPYRYRLDNIADGSLMSCLAVLVVAGIIFDSSSDDMTSVGLELMEYGVLSVIIVTIAIFAYVILGGHQHAISSVSTLALACCCPVWPCVAAGWLRRLVRRMNHTVPAPPDDDRPANNGPGMMNLRARAVGLHEMSAFAVYNDPMMAGVEVPEVDSEDGYEGTDGGILTVKRVRKSQPDDHHGLHAIHNMLFMGAPEPGFTPRPVGDDADDVPLKHHVEAGLGGASGPCGDSGEDEVDLIKRRHRGY